MNEEVKLVITDGDKIERRLRRIEEKLEKLFFIIDSYDDITDVTVALREASDKLSTIGQETTNFGGK